MKKILLIVVMITLVMGMLLETSTKSIEVFAATEKGQRLNVKELLMTQGKKATLKMRNTTGKIKGTYSELTAEKVSKNSSVNVLKSESTMITTTISKKNTNILIVYFSETGTTKKAAKKIQSLVEGDLVRIRTKKAYTKDYDTLTQIAEKESNSDTRPEITTTIENMEQYDIVMIGYPIWWGKEPMVIRTFLEKYNLSGKKIVPFCTSGGSGISESIRDIRSIAKDSIVLSGRDVTDDSRSNIRAWLKKIGVKTK